MKREWLITRPVRKPMLLNTSTNRIMKYCLNCGNIIKNDNAINCPRCKKNIFDEHPDIALSENGDFICPQCKGNLVERNGVFGFFYGCSNYYSLKCKFKMHLKSTFIDAVKSEKPRIIRQLLIKGANIYQWDENDCNAFYYSNADITNTLEEFAENDIKKYHKLINAIRNNNTTVVRNLLRENPYLVNICDRTCNTPLIIALQNYPLFDYRILLEVPKINVNLKNKNDETAMSLALKNNEKGTILYLLKSGAKKSPSLLLWAAKVDYTKLVKLLLENEIDTNLKDEKGYTALIYATKNNNLEMVRIILTSSKTDVDAKSMDGLTPLKYAIKNNNIEIIKYLMAAGSTPDYEGIMVNSTIQNYFYHFKSNIPKIVWDEFLLFKRTIIFKDMLPLYNFFKRYMYAYFNEFNGFRWHPNLNEPFFITKTYIYRNKTYPIISAVENNMFNFVKLFLKDDADIEVCNYDGKTALDIAKENGFKEIEKLLLTQV